MHTGFMCGNLREGGHLKDPGVYGRILLKWIFENLGGRMRVGSISSSCKCGDELSGFIKCGEFLG